MFYLMVAESLMRLGSAFNVKAELPTQFYKMQLTYGVYDKLGWITIGHFINKTWLYAKLRHVYIPMYIICPKWETELMENENTYFEHKDTPYKIYNPCSTPAQTDAILGNFTRNLVVYNSWWLPSERIM